jgi:hypothetical protein
MPDFHAWVHPTAVKFACPESFSLIA